jgi:hypothetical protein
VGDHEAEVPPEERSARRPAPYEEAFYGQHDRHLWAEDGRERGSLHADDWRYGSDEDEEVEEYVYAEEEEALGVDFANLHVSKVSTLRRRPSLLQRNH